MGLDATHLPRIIHTVFSSQNHAYILFLPLLSRKGAASAPGGAAGKEGQGLGQGGGKKSKA